MDYFPQDKDAQCPQKQKFAEWIRRDVDGIAEDVNTGSVEWVEKNMPTVGEEFGFLIIPMAYREENHLGECYQWVGNL